MNRLLTGSLLLLSLVIQNAEPESNHSCHRLQLSNTAPTQCDAVTRGATGVIGLEYEWLGASGPGATEIGQPRLIKVTVSAAIPIASLTADVYTHDGLVVSPMRWADSELQAFENTEVLLTVTPYMEGALSFSLLVRAEIDGRNQAAQITVPVRIGTAPAARAPAGGTKSDEPRQPR